MKKINIALVLILMLLIVGCSQQAGENVSTNQTNNPTQTEEEVQTKSDYPNRPIEFIVPYAAGGTTDIIARLFAEHASKYLPNEQPIVVVNKPGANGAIGATALLQAKADGYTIGITDVATFNIRPHIDDSVAFTHDSFQTIMQAVNVPQLIVTRQDAPWETFEEWLESVESSNDRLLIGTSGYGGLQHLVVQQIDDAVENPIEMVQFDGSAGVITAVLSGEVPVGVAGVPNALNNDQIRPLVNSGSMRSIAFPDLPTLKENGLDVEGDLYFGIFAPKGIADEQLEILHEAFKKAIQEQEVLEQLESIGYEITYGDPEQFQKIITDSYDRFGNVLRNAGIIK